MALTHFTCFACGTRQDVPPGTSRHDCHRCGAPWVLGRCTSCGTTWQAQRGARSVRCGSCGLQNEVPRIAVLAQEAVARATTGKSHPAPAAEPPTAEPPTAEPAADDLRVAEAIPASEHRCDRCDAPMAFHVVEDRRYCGRCHAGIVRRHRRVKATWLGATVLVVFLGIVAGAFILSRVGGPSIDPVIREVAVVPVPSVVGMLAADAREVLHAKGFTSTRVIGRRGDSGRVVSQDPPAGARAGVNVVVRLRVE